uniref:uncharacterized protein LOC122609817 isoform X1 n=2 Tax=Erigeron canadensis TaxID=72917 RepID=UPI001CB90485|nr:uncharacterized protein LOC122609817 isoform X1 [Erigeron canadensis]
MYTHRNYTIDHSVIDESDIINYGFQRPEMYAFNISGIVPPHERHVFLNYKTHRDWPYDFELSDSDPLPKLLIEVFEDNEDNMPKKTILTICEDTHLNEGDVLIFPDMILYRGLDASNIKSFVEQVLVKGKPWDIAEPEPVTGSYVFVCAHLKHDKWAAVCGPPLIERFNEEVEVKGLNNQVFVNPCSYIVGIAYAGNLIIFSAAKDGKVSGHWYGYVTPDDVPELLDQHIMKGEIIKRISRGPMGLIDIRGRMRRRMRILGVKGKSITSEKENVDFTGQMRTPDVKNKSITSEKENVGFFTRKWKKLDIFAVVVVGVVASVAVSYIQRKRLY